MMKKVAALALTGCLLTSMTVYAGDSKEEKVIHYSCWADGGEQEFVKKLAEQYEKEHEGVKVEVNFIPYGEYVSKLNTLMAADNMPDVFQLVEGDVFNWGSKGAVADLKPMYEKMGINPYDTMLEQDVFDDGEHIYGAGANTTTMCLYYNKELLEEAGIEAPSLDADNPWTWEEYVENAKLLTVDMSGKNATEEGFDPDDVLTYGTIMPTSWTRMMPLLYSNDVGFASEDGLSFDIAGEAGIEVVQAIANMSLVENCAPSDAVAQGSYSDTPTMLMNGQVAMYIDGAWSLSSYVNENFDVGVAQVPAFQHPANVTWTGGICVSPKAAEDEDVFDFFLYYTDFSNSLKVAEEQGISLGGLPQTKSIYETEEGMEEWRKVYGDFDAEEITTAYKNILTHENTVLGENVTLKNFPSIVDSTLIPALDNVWTGELTAKEVLESIDVSDKLEGSWVSAK